MSQASSSRPLQPRAALLAPASTALLGALCLLLVTDARVVDERLWVPLQGVALALCAAVAVLAFRAGRGAQGRVASLLDALSGGGVVGAMAALRHVYGPAWPAGTVVGLAVSAALTVRGGPLTARMLALALGLTEALPLVAGGLRFGPTVLGMAAACAALPLLVEGFSRAWRASVEDAQAGHVDARLRAMDQDAQDYRLIATATALDLPAEVREARRAAGSVNLIRETRYELLELAARIFEPHSAILFRLDADGKNVRVDELITKSDFVVTGPLPADKGVIGTVLKKRLPLMLHNVQDSFAGVTWYHPPAPPKALAAVPVVEGEHLRGVLLLDWQAPRALTDRDAVVLGDIARQLVRVQRNEQLFAMLDREKVRADTLFKTSQAFIETLRLQDTYATTLRTARQLFDAGVAVLILAEDGALKVGAVDGVPAEWTGRAVTDELGLLGRCIKRMELTPAAGAPDPERLRVLLGAELPLDGMESVRLCPLVENQACWGVLLIAAARRNAFGWVMEDQVRTLATLASLSVANRRMYDRMEKMATTDGLTGLVNHRTFQERFAESLKRAARYNRPISMFLTDIDHFKNVNDTYGHPVGDEVIRRVSKVLAGMARGTDMVARYGGEEFACVMEETDAEGAQQLADRVRIAVQNEVVQTEMGPLKVTLSLGVAQFPIHGTEKHVLIERADQALYAAKHGGRNRTVVATAPEASHALAAEKA
jgi:two-component system cell cycle response regulator